MALKLFNRSRKSRDVTSFLEFLGIDHARRDELSQAAYFACLKVLAESMGKMPLHLQRKDKNGGIVTATEHPLYSVMKYRPNSIMSSTGFFGTIEMNRNHYGNSYVLITGAGSNTQLIPLDSEAVTVWYDDAMILAGSPKLYFQYSCKGKLYWFEDSEVLHFRSSTSFDGILGLAVKDVLEENFRGLQAAQDMQNDLYTNGLTAKMVLQYTSGLSEENRDEFVRGVEAFAAGKMEASKNIIPVPTGTTVTPLNLKLADAQFAELKKYSALEIAAAMGIKPNQINDYDKSSYSSAEAQQLSFYVDTLLYIIKLYEDELNYKLLSPEERKMGYFFKFNFNVLLRADLATQTSSLCQAIQNSLYTPNEAREFVDKPALPGGDSLLCNGSMLPVQFAGVQYTGGKEVSA